LGLQTQLLELVWRVLAVYAAIGGDGLGWSMAEPQEYKGLRGRFQVIGGIEVDPWRAAQFERIVGAPCHVLDLFERRDYIAYHGHEPPPGWQEVTPEDLRRRWPLAPDVIILSPPCKSFSPLLPPQLAQSEKYQALARLFYRGVWLCLQAWPDDPPAIIRIENVPGVKQRGAHILQQVRELLHSHGYEVDERDHDLGEEGGLGARRPRYKLLARNRGKIPYAHVFLPPRRGLKTVGQALGDLPMPGDPSAGPLHRLPKLDWLTWLRLSLIPPGGDWKDLPGPGEWALYTLDGREVPPDAWSRRSPPDPRTWGRIFVAQLVPGARHCPDIRLGHSPMGHGRGALWVQHPGEPGGVVTADPSTRKAGGAAAWADLRLKYMPRTNSHVVLDSQRPGPVVNNASVTRSNGPGAFADPKVRLTTLPRNGVLAVQGPGRTGRNGTEHPDPKGEAPSLVDLRMGCQPRNGTMGVVAWDGVGPTIIAALDVYAGAAAVEDRRTDQLQVHIVHWPEWFPPFIILSPWNAWHRPLTDLELAVLQGFPSRWPDGRPFVLEGTRRQIRSAIGDAVPPLAAKAEAETVLRTLLRVAVEGRDAWFLSPLGTPVWVRQGWGEPLQ